MRHITLLLVASMGCGLQIGEPDTVDVTVAWSIKDFETGAMGCPAAFPKIHVGFSNYGESIPHWFISTHDCAAGKATIPMWQPGSVEDEDGNGDTHDYELTGHYTVIVDLLGEQEEALHGESLPVEIDVTKGGTGVETRIVPGGNFFSFIWKLTSQADELVTCAKAGVATIEMRYQLYDMTDPMIVDRFPCDSNPQDAQYEEASGVAYSSPIRPDSYTGYGVALDASGKELARTEEVSMTGYPPGYAPYAVTRIPFSITMP